MENSGVKRPTIVLYHDNVIKENSGLKPLY